MSYADFVNGLTAEQVRRQREIARAAEARARAAADDELVGILRPITAEEASTAELAERRRARCA